MSRGQLVKTATKNPFPEIRIQKEISSILIRDFKSNQLSQIQT